jgi:hypothetical protein
MGANTRQGTARGGEPLGDTRRAGYSIGEPDAWEPDDYYRGESVVVHAPDARSIFDDVDE